MKLRTTSAAAASPDIPAAFRCPISLDLMSDPVVLPESGHTFDRSSIERWLSSGNATCPVTRAPLSLPRRHRLIPNHTLRRLIEVWSRETGGNALASGTVGNIKVIMASNSEVAPKRSAQSRSDSTVEEDALMWSDRLAALLSNSGASTAAAANVIHRLGWLAATSLKVEQRFTELGTVSFLASLAFEDSDQHHHRCHFSTPRISARNHGTRSWIQQQNMDCNTTPDSISGDGIPASSPSVDALIVLSTCFRFHLPNLILPYATRLAFLSHLLLCGRSPPTARAAAAVIVASLAAGGDYLPPPDDQSIDHTRATIGTTPLLFLGLVSLIRHHPTEARQFPALHLRQSEATIRCCMASVKAIFTLCLCNANWTAAIRAGTPAALLEWLAEEESTVEDAKKIREMAVATIELLCKTAEGRRVVAEHPLAVSQMRRIVADGGGGNRAGECAAGVLLAIARISEDVQAVMVEEGVVALLLLLLQRQGSSGRAKRNAIALLKLLQSNWSEHPCISQVSHTLVSARV